MDKDRLSSLYGHWIIAESVSFHLVTSLRSHPSFHLSTEHSRRVWQSLLYVVVEGYQTLNLRDAVIDAILDDAGQVQKLRRFRNATFHHQEDPLSAKYWDFKADPDSELWVVKLNAAFRSFFERELPDHPLSDYLCNLSEAKRSGK
ncbi:hypothetical protein [Rhizobium phaseoli]|uniref:hypothetical protein n=1 Tax=Rhizobium phaseoli TaxID=396 RepID=UPI0014382FE0|nr:hypothetical protein [Rhizobium phaseoli]MDK4730579.1 hypothetical protein [Rhizobium phaseoli]NKE91865.1 hypothetical protein [Rhizobium phaseoli]